MAGDMPGHSHVHKKLVIHETPDDVYWDPSVVHLDPILAAEAEHGPVFRRELFNTAYAAHQLLNKRSPDQRSDDKHDRITLQNIYGIERSLSPMKEGSQMEERGRTYRSKLAWIYHGIQSLGHRYGRTRSELFSYSFGLRYTQLEPTDCFVEKGLEPKAALWAKEWQSSEMCRRLTKFLEHHVGQSTHPVNKIVCFGLGCFQLTAESDEWVPSATRAYMQHLAACTIRDIITRQQQGAPTPKMFAQEPVYCDAAKAYLAKNFDISVLDDPEGFKILDGHTFVLSFAPNVPVRQIAYGLTHEFGGPAGMFCDDIKTEGLECNGKGDESTIDKTYGRVNVAPYSTCESSPGLWKYKQDSLWEEYSDRTSENWFGNPGIYLKKMA